MRSFISCPELLFHGFAFLGIYECPLAVNGNFLFVEHNAVNLIIGSLAIRNLESFIMA